MNPTEIQDTVRAVDEPVNEPQGIADVADNDNQVNEDQVNDDQVNAEFASNDSAPTAMVSAPAASNVNEPMVIDPVNATKPWADTVDSDHEHEDMDVVNETPAAAKVKAPMPSQPPAVMTPGIPDMNVMMAHMAQFIQQQQLQMQLMFQQEMISRG